MNKQTVLRLLYEPSIMSKQIVEQAKADLLAAGVDLSGNNGAFKITMEAASRIPGAGVVDKPNGNHAEFNGASYSVDGIMFQDGRFFDVLVDGGGRNDPSWSQGDNIDPARYRPASAVLGHSTQPTDSNNTAPFEAAMRSFDEDVRASLGRVEGALQGAAALLDVAHVSFDGASTAYVKFDLKPAPAGGFTAYVKFDLKPLGK